jgi:hypothetical protein
MGNLDLDTFTPEFSMPRMLARAALVLMLAFTACTAGNQSKRPATQRERDSVLGASQLPGATGVRGAIRAQDSAAARNARLDSVASQR